MEAAVRPMGYWIKEIDRRIEAALGRLLADEMLTRRHWQVLTTLAGEEEVTRAALDAALAPFAPTVRPELDDLIGRGWVTGRPAGAVALTAPGRVVHDRVAERVHSFRARVTEGLTDQDHRTLLALLERVAGNLTPA